MNQRIKQFIAVIFSITTPLLGIEDGEQLFDSLQEAVELYSSDDVNSHLHAHALAPMILHAINNPDLVDQAIDYMGQTPDDFWYEVNELRAARAILLSRDSDDLENLETQQEVDSLIDEVMQAQDGEVSGNTLARIYNLKIERLISIIRTFPINAIPAERITQVFTYLDEMINGFPNMDLQWDYEALYNKAYLLAYLGRCSEAMAPLQRILTEDPRNMFADTRDKATMLRNHCRAIQQQRYEDDNSRAQIVIGR